MVAVPMAATAPGAAHLVHGPSQVAMSVHSAFHLARLGAELPAAFLEKRCAQHGDDGQRRDPAGSAPPASTSAEVPTPASTEATAIAGST